LDRAPAFMVRRCDRYVLPGQLIGGLGRKRHGKNREKKQAYHGYR